MSSGSDNNDDDWETSSDPVGKPSRRASVSKADQAQVADFMSAALGNRRAAIDPNEAEEKKPTELEAELADLKKRQAVKKANKQVVADNIATKSAQVSAAPTPDISPTPTPPPTRSASVSQADAPISAATNLGDINFNDLPRPPAPPTRSASVSQAGAPNSQPAPGQKQQESLDTLPPPPPNDTQSKVSATSTEHAPIHTLPLPDSVQKEQAAALASAAVASVDEVYPKLEAIREFSQQAQIAVEAINIIDQTKVTLEHREYLGLVKAQMQEDASVYESAAKQLIGDKNPTNLLDPSIDQKIIESARELDARCQDLCEKHVGQIDQALTQTARPDQGLLKQHNQELSALAEIPNINPATLQNAMDRNRELLANPELTVAAALAATVTQPVAGGVEAEAKKAALAQLDQIAKSKHAILDKVRGYDGWRNSETQGGSTVTNENALLLGDAQVACLGDLALVRRCSKANDQTPLADINSRISEHQDNNGKICGVILQKANQDINRLSNNSTLEERQTALAAHKTLLAETSELYLAKDVAQNMAKTLSLSSALIDPNNAAKPISQIKQELESATELANTTLAQEAPPPSPSVAAAAVSSVLKNGSSEEQAPPIPVRGAAHANMQADLAAAAVARQSVASLSSTSRERSGTVYAHLDQEHGESVVANIQAGRANATANSPVTRPSSRSGPLAAEQVTATTSADLSQTAAITPTRAADYFKRKADNKKEAVKQNDKDARAIRDAMPAPFIPIPSSRTISASETTEPDTKLQSSPREQSAATTLASAPTPLASAARPAPAMLTNTAGQRLGLSDAQISNYESLQGIKKGSADSLQVITELQATNPTVRDRNGNVKSNPVTAALAKAESVARNNREFAEELENRAKRLAEQEKPNKKEVDKFKKDLGTMESRLESQAVANQAAHDAILGKSNRVFQEADRSNEPERSALLSNQQKELVLIGQIAPASSERERNMQITDRRISDLRTNPQAVSAEAARAVGTEAENMRSARSLNSAPIQAAPNTLQAQPTQPSANSPGMTPRSNTTQQIQTERANEEREALTSLMYSAITSLREAREDKAALQDLRALYTDPSAAAILDAKERKAGLKAIETSLKAADQLEKVATSYIAKPDKKSEKAFGKSLDKSEQSNAKLHSEASESFYSKSFSNHSDLTGPQAAVQNQRIAIHLAHLQQIAKLSGEQKDDAEQNVAVVSYLQQNSAQAGSIMANPEMYMSKMRSEAEQQKAIAARLEREAAEGIPGVTMYPRNTSQQMNPTAQAQAQYQPNAMTPAPTFGPVSSTTPGQAPSATPSINAQDKPPATFEGLMQARDMDKVRGNDDSTKQYFAQHDVNGDLLTSLKDKDGMSLMHKAAELRDQELFYKLADAGMQFEPMDRGKDKAADINRHSEMMMFGYARTPKFADHQEQISVLVDRFKDSAEASHVIAEAIQAIPGKVRIPDTLCKFEEGKGYKINLEEAQKMNLTTQMFYPRYEEGPDGQKRPVRIDPNDPNSPIINDIVEFKDGKVTNLIIFDPKNKTSIHPESRKDIEAQLGQDPVQVARGPTIAPRQEMKPEKDLPTRQPGLANTQIVIRQDPEGQSKVVIKPKEEPKPEPQKPQQRGVPLVEPHKPERHKEELEGVLRQKPTGVMDPNETEKERKQKGLDDDLLYGMRHNKPGTNDKLKEMVDNALNDGSAKKLDKNLDDGKPAFKEDGKLDIDAIAKLHPDCDILIERPGRDGKMTYDAVKIQGGKIVDGAVGEPRDKSPLSKDDIAKVNQASIDKEFGKIGEGREKQAVREPVREKEREPAKEQTRASDPRNENQDVSRERLNAMSQEQALAAREAARGAVAAKREAEAAVAAAARADTTPKPVTPTATAPDLNAAAERREEAPLPQRNLPSSELSQQSEVDLTTTRPDPFAATQSKSPAPSESVQARGMAELNHTYDHTIVARESSALTRALDSAKSEPSITASSLTPSTEPKPEQTQGIKGQPQGLDRQAVESELQTAVMTRDQGGGVALDMAFARELLDTHKDKQLDAGEIRYLSAVAAARENNSGISNTVDEVINPPVGSKIARDIEALEYMRENKEALAEQGVTDLTKAKERAYAAVDAKAGRAPDLQPQVFIDQPGPALDRQNHDASKQKPPAHAPETPSPASRDSATQNTINTVAAAATAKKDAPTPSTSQAAPATVDNNSLHEAAQLQKEKQLQEKEKQAAAKTSDVSADKENQHPAEPLKSALNAPQTYKATPESKVKDRRTASLQTGNAQNKPTAQEVAAAARSSSSSVKIDTRNTTTTTQSVLGNTNHTFPLPSRPNSQNVRTPGTGIK